MRYFAYGSNMDPVQMAERCPGATATRIACLKRSRVVFVADPSGFEGGVATVVADPACDVWGVVWEIAPGHLDALDEWEAYPIAYDRRFIQVLSPQPVDALVYVAKRIRPQAPAPGYLEGILRGATVHGLPGDYVARLRRWTREPG